MSDEYSYNNSMTLRRDEHLCALLVQKISSSRARLCFCKLDKCTSFGQGSEETRFELISDDHEMSLKGLAELMTDSMKTSSANDASMTI